MKINLAKSAVLFVILSSLSVLMACNSDTRSDGVKHSTEASRLERMKVITQRNERRFEFYGKVLDQFD